MDNAVTSQPADGPKQDGVLMVCQREDDQLQIMFNESITDGQLETIRGAIADFAEQRHQLEKHTPSQEGVIH